MGPELYSLPPVCIFLPSTRPAAQKWRKRGKNLPAARRTYMQRRGKCRDGPRETGPSRLGLRADRIGVRVTSAYVLAVQQLINFRMKISKNSVTYRVERVEGTRASQVVQVVVVKRAQESGIPSTT